jgi:hypothetical protein
MLVLENQSAVYSSYMSTGSAENLHLQQVIVDFGKRSNDFLELWQGLLSAQRFF